MKRNFQRAKSVDAIYGGIAMNVTAKEAADYIREMLEGLHAMAIHPVNHKLRLTLGQALMEARNAMDDQRLSRTAHSPSEFDIGQATVESRRKIKAS
jgi:hypothetical protein